MYEIKVVHIVLNVFYYFVFRGGACETVLSA